MKKLIIISATIALANAACTKADVDRAQNAIASAAPKLANDSIIYAQIESKFVAIDGDSALHVAVASHDGKVRISGRVKSADIEAKYVDAAGHVDGVKHVDAALTVDGALPSAKKQADDFALATAVRLNETGQAGVNGVKLGIAASDGVVTLTGDVASEALHKTILDTARSTAGVRDVVDHLNGAT